MKNLLIGMATCMLLSITLSAQDYGHHTPNRTFGKGQADLQLGYGLLSTSALLDDAKTLLPPLSIRAQRFLGNNFSLGVGYTQSSHQSKPIITLDGIAQRVTNSTHQATLQAAFHVTRLDNADLYGGFRLAVNFQDFSVDYGDFTYLSEHMGIHPKSTKATYTGFIGARYAFTKKWSTFGEIGFSTALVTVGIGYRI